MAYDLIKISALPAATPDESQEIVVGVGDYAKRINYGDVKADMVGTSPTYTTDTEPYLTRQTAHTGVVGKCALNKLVGGSLGWNQLITTLTGGSASGITVTANASSGSITASGTATANGNVAITDRLTILADHKYLLKGSKGAGKLGMAGGAQNDNGNGAFLAFSTTATRQIFYVFSSGQTLSETLYPQLFDLTAMFGSTIADYAYSLGVTSGVAWLRKYIDIDSYHAYDAGSIQSVQATAHVTKDANDNVIGNYPLGSDTLRGIPQLVSNKLKYDGDEKYPDGTIRRKYGIVDLGSQNWNIGGTGTYRRFYTSETNLAKAPSTQDDDVNIICDSYVASPFNTLLTTDKRISINTTGAINISDSAYASSTGAQFKTAMSGKYLVYEKATESTESSTAYQKIQTIDADGTESFTTSSPVPVGHETQTPDNILAALNWLGE